MIRTRLIHQVGVVQVSGRLSDVVEDLDQAIQLALAEGPRGVVCDLSNMVGGADPATVAALATLGHHVRDWPGIPLAVACPDSRVREALPGHPFGGHLILTASLFTALSEVLAIPALAIEQLRLASHPTAPRAARNFVTRTLLDWGLGRVIPFASLVVSELVSSSSRNAGTDIDLSVAWCHGALRLTVRDHGPALAGQRRSALDLHGRGLDVVTGLSRVFGLMPAADGGKVLWAVLDAPRPQFVTRRVRSKPPLASHESAVLADGRDLASLPLCASSSRQPA